MPITLGTNLTPSGSFPIVDLNYVKGAPMIVADATARDGIPSLRRTIGMEVTVISPLGRWRLESDQTTWTEVVASGGAAISDVDVGYLRSDGNDTTGDGSPGAPFLTAQAAVDAGFVHLDLGVGGFGDIDFGGTVAGVITLRGRGAATSASIIGSLENAGHNLIVIDAGGMSVLIAAIVTTGFAADAGNIIASGVSVTTLTAEGGLGTTTGYGGGNITVTGPASVGSASSAGGPGADVDDADNPSPNGGPGGAILISGGVVLPAANFGFAGGAPGANAGAGGLGSAGSGGSAVGHGILIAGAFLVSYP